MRGDPPGRRRDPFYDIDWGYSLVPWKDVLAAKSRLWCERVNGTCVAREGDPPLERFYRRCVNEVIRLGAYEEWKALGRSADPRYIIEAHGGRVR